MFWYEKSVWTVIARFPHCLSLASEEEYDVLLLSFSVQEALSNLEDYDKTCVESALQGVSNVVQQEWGSACPCQVLGVPYTTSSHLNPLLFRYNWCMDKTFFQWFQLPALIYCSIACLCTSFLCPVGGAGYGWISWYWKGFPTSLPANTEASWGRQEVPTAFPFPYQNVHHVCSQRRGGTMLYLFLAIQQLISIYSHLDSRKAMEETWPKMRN